MEISPIRQPLYTKQDIKREAHSAAISAGLSAGVTLLINKGEASYKTAGKVGLLAAGVSVALGFIQQMVSRAKNKNQNIECGAMLDTKRNTTQG